MKSGKLLICLAMLALALGVLTATAYAMPTGPDTDKRPITPQAPAAALDAAPAQTYEWAKYVNGVPWTPDIAITLQTSDTLQVTEIVTTVLPFTQTESWQPARLRLLGWEVSPGGVVMTSTGYLEWRQTPTGPGPWYINKWFHVEPCTWAATTLWEDLSVEGGEYEQRSVTIDHLLPALWIDATYEAGVLAGFPASFALSYGNTGGLESAAGVYNNFPATAPFLSSVPPPTYVGPGGLYVEWSNLGTLPQGATGVISVTVAIQPGLLPGTTIEIWDYIYDHTFTPRDSVLITFLVEPEFVWTKLINGVVWEPNMTVTVQTSDTIVIEEMVDSPQEYTLVENWDPAHLRLDDYAISGGVVITSAGQLEWHVPSGMPLLTITKWFHVEPCTWTDTLLQEMLVVDGLAPVYRPVPIHKVPPALWIDAQGGGSALPGQPAELDPALWQHRRFREQGHDPQRLSAGGAPGGLHSTPRPPGSKRPVGRVGPGQPADGF